MRNHLVAAGVVAMLSVSARAQEGGAPTIEARPVVAAASAEPANAFQLRLGFGDAAPLGIFGVGIGGIGGIAGAGVAGGVGGVGVLGTLGMSLTPSVGLTFERRLGRQWSFTAGVSGSFSGADNVATSYAVSLAPGVRWYLGDRLFSGAWASAALPMTLSESIAPGLRSTATSGGLELMLGYSARFSNGFMASLGAGPTLRISRARAAADGGEVVATSGGFGLRAMASVGLLF